MNNFIHDKLTDSCPCSHWIFLLNLFVLYIIYSGHGNSPMCLSTLLQVQEDHDLNSGHTQFHDHTDNPAVTSSAVQAESKLNDDSTSKCELEHFESGELKKLDSFGRWMDREIGGDCDDSMMASDSGNYWNTLGAHNGDKEVSSLHMQLDMDSLGPSLSQEQLFSIQEFSPDWAYAGVKTKVYTLLSYYVTFLCKCLNFLCGYILKNIIFKI